MKEKLFDRYKVAIIGMGSGGFKLAQIFFEDPDIEIIGVANRRQSAAGIQWAKKQGLFTTPDYRELLTLPKLDIVIDATGSPEVERHLRGLENPSFEIIEGMTAGLVWRIVEEREQRERESSRHLNEHKRLYVIGLMLANAENSKFALKLIVEAAMDMLEMTAGSAALFNEESGELRMAVALGFRTGDMADYCWKVRQGGLTGHILSNSEPTTIEDLETCADFDTSQLKKQGFRSLLAIPLKAEGRIIGILYVDDFRPRKFTAREKSIMGLLGALAASAVEKVLMLERAEEMAITDELTRVYNHRHFLRSLNAEIKRVARYGEPLSLCMIDVDHFKRFNDTHGHLKGNEVLVEVARIIRHCARETDVAARYGGEEFAVVLPKTGREKALLFGERLRQAVEKFPFPGGESQPGGKLTISLGLTTFPDDGADENAASIVEKADQALYQSKKDGRNRVTVYENR